MSGIIGSVYCIDFPNGKSYVGITRKIAVRRVCEHLKSTSTVGKAIRRFGKEQIAWRILQRTYSAPKLCALERTWIQRLGTRHPDGYNLTSGGQGVLDLCSPSERKRVENMRKTMATPEYKAKQVAIQQEVWTDAAKKVHSWRLKRVYRTTDLRQRLSIAHTGKKNTAEACRKIGVAMNRYYQENPGARVLQAERSRKMWRDPEARRKRKEWSKAYWAARPGQGVCPPEKREEAQRKSAAAKRTPEYRAKTSAKTKQKMQDPEARLKIAETLSIYGGCRFRKTQVLMNCRSDSLRLLKVWDKTPEVASFRELWFLGWCSRMISFCLSKGWLEQIDA